MCVRCRRFDARQTTLENPLNATAGEGFGSAVSLYLDHALVSAPFHAPNSQGAAFLFRKFNGSDWYARVRLTAADAVQSVSATPRTTV